LLWYRVWAYIVMIAEMHQMVQSHTTSHFLIAFRAYTKYVIHIVFIFEWTVIIYQWSVSSVDSCSVMARKITWYKPESQLTVAQVVNYFLPFYFYFWILLLVMCSWVSCQSLYQGCYIDIVAQCPSIYNIIDTSELVNTLLRSTNGIQML